MFLSFLMWFLWRKTQDQNQTPACQTSEMLKHPPRVINQPGTPMSHGGRAWLSGQGCWAWCSCCQRPQVAALRPKGQPCPPLPLNPILQPLWKIFPFGGEFPAVESVLSCCQLEKGASHLPLQGLNHEVLKLLNFNTPQKEFRVELRNKALCLIGKSCKTGLQIFSGKDLMNPNACVFSYLDKD